MKFSEKEFIAESGEILEEANGLLLEIQDTFKKGVNPDTINALFRSMHTLKGTAGLFGYQAVTDVSHALETLLDDIRLDRVEISDEVMAFLFKYIDILRHLVEELKDKGRPADVSRYLKDIESFRESLKGRGEPRGLEDVIDESMLKVLSEYEEHRLKTNIAKGRNIYIVKTVFPIAEFDRALGEVTKKIKSFGELISTMPMSQDVPDSIGFNLMVGSSRTPEEIKRAVDFDIDVLFKAISVKEKPVEVPEKVKEASLKTAAATTMVRVDIEKLDRILDTISELALARDAIRRVWAEIVELYGHNPLVVDMYRITQTLQRRIAELQEQVLAIRMVPVRQIFGRLSQVIRRYSREVGKNIDLAIFGEDTEIDKYLAEEIMDPLVHIIRNAIDHGIELPDERGARDKKETGTVILKAFQRGNHVVIEVRDDGRGIDAEKIKQRAIDLGLVEPGADVSEKEIVEFIFMPGFSTKDSVNEVSGRGVGTDIVRERLSALGGFVDVETDKGLGTTFTLTLPITLAVIKALIVRVGTERFAVPLSSMSETFVVEHRLLQTIENRKVYNLKGDMLPMTSLAEKFGLPGDSSDRSFAVVLWHGERKIGLLVDEFLGQHEVVIKSLGDYFEGFSGFAGAAEIGKHEVILVIDVEAIIGESIKKGTLHV